MGKIKDREVCTYAMHGKQWNYSERIKNEVSE
jgi:hypothetical protein